MGRVVEFERGIHLSISAFAAEVSSTRETISKRIADAKLKPSGKRGGHPVYRLKDLFKAVYQAGDGGIDPDKLDPFQRKAHYQAEHEKLQLETDRGQLVPAIEVEAKFAANFKTMAQWLDTLPDVLERDCGASPVLLAKIERRIDGLREELYQQLTGEGDAQRTVRDGT
jgi:hypothetical protein